MVTWAKENAASSGLSDRPIRWLVDDCVKFVEREIRRGNHYDAIIMDPPSYGRGPKGEIWKIEDAIHPLIKLCTQILSDDPLFFLVNSYTTGLAPAVLTYMLGTELKNGNGHVESQEIGLPVTHSGLVLAGLLGDGKRFNAIGTDFPVLNKNIEALSVLIQSWSNSYAQKALLYFLFSYVFACSTH